MISNEQKQIARQRRERKFRLWLTTLSWTMPVIAFGSFFSIWHSISSAVTSPVKSKPSVSVVTNHPVSNATSENTQSKSETSSVLFKVGSKSPQVSVIQEQLYELGYFNHVITEYYGPVTAQAVQSFQMAQHLNVTGEIDNATLHALNRAVKFHHTSRLVSSNAPSSHATTSTRTMRQTTTTSPSTRDSSPSSTAVSHQSVPQTSSSAS